MAPTRWLLLAVALLAVPAPTPAVAQGYGGAAEGDGDAAQERPSYRWGRHDAPKPDGSTWGRTYTVDERTGRRLAEALEQLQAERYAEAEKTLDGLRMRGLNPFERAQTYRIRGFVEYGKGNLAEARRQLELALAEDALSFDEQATIRFQIAQLYLAEEQWAEVVKHLGTWFEMVERPESTITPNSSAYYLLAIAYYQLEDLGAALEPATRAVEIADVPQESWLQLLLALRLTRREYAEAVPLLEQLVELYPSKTYWLQLSTVWGALENYEEAVVPLQLAYTQGLLDTGDELKRLAQLLLFLELPYRAARVMQRGFEEERIEEDVESYELLSNSWIAAREYDRAVAPLEHAAELAETGDLYVRLAQVHIQREEWNEAADALRRALERGLDKPGDAQLLMGIAFFSQKRPETARSWFDRARRHAETREEADTWIQYIDRELAQG